MCYCVLYRGESAPLAVEQFAEQSIIRRVFKSHDRSTTEVLDCSANCSRVLRTTASCSRRACGKLGVPSAFGLFSVGVVSDAIYFDL